MTNFLTVISILIVLIVVVPALLSVAYVTVAERKTMASMQRRLGPNIVGYWGLLQAFADALKLLLKEYVSPNQANIILFFLGPIITLVFSLLGYGVVPYGPGLAIWDFDLGILYMLAVSSLATYGILLAGWSANSKYAFLGALRSTAQLISYELILSSAILLVILLTGSLNLTVNIEVQRAIWFTIPLLPIFIIFFIGSVAETNRAPFDLAEAESELVSGFMTEHAAVIFVFFFLAEYGSIVLICIFNSILFLGGYLYDSFIYNDLLIYLLEDLLHISINAIYFDLSNNPIIEGLLYGTTLGIKTSIMVFTFIWVRASFPRIRFDQLMTYSWTMLLPIVIGFIILVPCNIFEFDIIPANISLLLFWPFKSTNRDINLFKRFFEKRVKLWGIPINWLSLLISSVIAAVMSFVIRILLLQFWEFDLLDLTKDTGLKFLIVLSIIFIRKLIKELSEYLLIQYSQNIGNKNIFFGKMLAFRNVFTNSSSSSSSSTGNGEGTSNSTSINQTSITNVREASNSNSNNSERSSSSSSSSSSSNRDSTRNNTTGNTVSSQDRNLITRGRTPNRILLPRRNTEFNRSRSPVLEYINYRDRSTNIQNPQPIGLNNTNRLLHNLGEVYYRPISPIRSFLVHGGVYHNNHPNYYLETFVSPDTDEAPQWRGRPNNIARLANIPLYEDNPDIPINIPRSNDPNITYPHTAFWAFVISDGVYATHMSNIPYSMINGNIIISDPNNVSRILPFDENNNFTYVNYHPYIGNLWHVLEFYDAEYNMVPSNRRPLPVSRMGSNTLRFLQNIVESEYRGQPPRAGAMFGRNNITRFRLNQSIRNRLLVIYNNRRLETI